MKTLSCGEQCLLQTTSVQVGLLLQLGEQTSRKTLRKIFLTCYSEFITSFTHPDLPLGPQILQVDCSDLISLQVSVLHLHLLLMSWCVGLNDLVSSLRLIIACALLTQIPGTCSLFLLVCQDGFYKLCFIS